MNQKTYISIDILNIMKLIEKNNLFARSPNLDTVLMVEKFIEQHSAEFNRTELWKGLPRKVMWQTYLIILDYLHNINKIGFDKEGVIIYLWNPKLAKLIEKRKRY